MVESRQEASALEIYNYTTLGTSLKSTLDTFEQNGRISENLRGLVMNAYKEALHEVMTERVKLQGHVKGKMHTYRNNQGVYTFYVEQAKLQAGDHNYNAQMLKIVCVDEKRTPSAPARRSQSEEPHKRLKK